MAFIDLQNEIKLIDRHSHCFLSGILSFTTGTTCSRRRSLCTSTQIPTSPACDQRRLHSHASRGLRGPTPPPHDAAVLVGVHRRLMLRSSRTTGALAGLQDRDVGSTVQQKLVLCSSTLAETGATPVLRPSDAGSLVSAVPAELSVRSITSNPVGSCQVLPTSWRPGSFGRTGGSIGIHDCEL